jgi:hypothetical protein
MIYTQTFQVHTQNKIQQMTCMGDEKCWQTVPLIMHLLYELLNSLCSKLYKQIQNRTKLNKHMYGYTFQRTGAQSSCRSSSVVGELKHTSFHKTTIYHSSTSIYCKLMNRWLHTIPNPRMFTKNKSQITIPSQKSSNTNCNITLTTSVFSDISYKFCIISLFLHTNYMIYQS